VAAAVVGVLLACAPAHAVDYVFPTQPGPFALTANDTLTIESGTYNGTISSFPTGARVFVNAGATLNLSRRITMSGTLVVRPGGTALFPGVNIRNGFNITVDGTLRFTSAPSISGTGTFLVGPTGTMESLGDVSFTTGMAFTNRGTSIFSQQLTVGTSTTFTNDGTVRGLRASDNFRFSGVFTNNGLFETAGQVTINSASVTTNTCALIARNGLINNATSTRNEGIWMTVEPGSSMRFSRPIRMVPGAYMQAGGTGASAFINDGSAPGINGGGNVFIAGTSTNRGVFGSASDPINVFDQTAIDAGRFFDVQSVAPNASTTRLPITPLTVADARTRCTYNPLLLPPVANNDSPVRSSSPSAPFTFSVLANDTAGAFPIAPGAVRLVGAGNTLVTSLVAAGQGTWSVNTTTGEVTFTPQAGYTGFPSPVSYRAADTQGNRSNAATITITGPPPPGTVLTAAKAVVFFSRNPAVDCAGLAAPEAGPDIFMPGACIEYRITVSNTGVGAANAVRLFDALDANIEFISASQSGFGGAALTAPPAGTLCGFQPCEVLLTGGALAPGATGTLRIRARVAG
jgi:uncharacterized repeat protein (TIGR01451 family)